MSRVSAGTGCWERAARDRRTHPYRQRQRRHGSSPESQKTPQRARKLMTTEGNQRSTNSAKRRAGKRRQPRRPVTPCRRWRRRRRRRRWLRLGRDRGRLGRRGLCPVDRHRTCRRTISPARWRRSTTSLWPRRWDCRRRHDLLDSKIRQPRHENAPTRYMYQWC